MAAAARLFTRADSRVPVFPTIRLHAEAAIEASLTDSSARAAGPRTLT